jgi:hypothetical protein
MKKQILIVLAFALLAVVMVGCVGTTTITEFDKDGKITKKTESTEPPIMTIEKSLKNKMVVMWGDGLRMSGSVSPGSTENPTPHVEGKFANGNGGGATIPKDMKPDAIEAVAKVIQATKSSAKMGISSDGVSISGKQAIEAKESTADSDVKNSEAIK